jgi:hypothetical protein
MLAITPVTLTGGDSGESMSLTVKMYPAARDAKMYPQATEYQWGVKIASKAVYPTSRDPVSTGDTISWTSPRGTKKTGNLQPGGETYGALAQRTFFFNETSP